MTTGGKSFAGWRILLVEDNFQIAVAMADLLRQENAEIIGPVGTVKDALALIAHAERIDAAVLDINLSGEMVYPVADVLRSKGVPILFMTGYDATSVRPSYADVPCLQKPVAIERLIETLLGLGAKSGLNQTDSMRHVRSNFRPPVS